MHPILDQRAEHGPLPDEERLRGRCCHLGALGVECGRPAQVFVPLNASEFVHLVDAPPALLLRSGRL
ncbi:MAG: hypothetical protein M3O64_03375 [Chloroflexota bacterium]|nr:hypothetical protein [Chloroflexota bacterium]